MRPEDFDLPEVDNEDALDLSKVELVRFTATPSEIGPFGSSALEWRIRAPDRLFRYTLRNRVVASQGTMQVSPLETTRYGLRVSLGRLSRTLGTETVSVDLDHCQEIELRQFFVQLRNLLQTIVDNREGVVFRARPRRRNSFEPVTRFAPEITEDSGAIRIVLRLRRIIDDRPDPDVTITIRFSLTVEDGALAFRRLGVSARVTVPWYVWLLPGSMLIIPPLLNNGEQEAVEFGEDLADVVLAYLDAATTGPEGLRKHSVRFFVDELSEVLDVKFCGTGTPPVE